MHRSDLYVLGVDGGASGHRIVLFCVGDIGDKCLPEAVSRRCRAHPPSYMVPSVVRVLHDLPLNTNGKLDESMLRTMLSPCTEGT